MTKREPNNVRYCQHCRCKTWHCDDVCEWNDMHRQVPEPDGGGVQRVQEDGK